MFLARIISGDINSYFRRVSVFSHWGSRCKISERHEDVTFSPPFYHVATATRAYDKFQTSSISAVIYFPSLSLLSNRPVLPSLYHCVTLCAHKTIPRGYRIIEARISRRQYRRRVPAGTVYTSRRAREEGILKRVSANMANQLLSNLPLALAVFR